MLVQVVSCFCSLGDFFSILVVDCILSLRFVGGLIIVD